MDIKGKNFDHHIVIALQFSHKTKTVEISLKKRELFHQAVETQIKCRLKSVNLSLIGIHEYFRKELLNIALKELHLNFYLNEKQF